ncbi:MAG: hypothetical protein K6F00_11130 [Lachnospiraceae bacterium]|nr:hypothetical protein [Lachnospiraceae bacterium]
MKKKLINYIKDKVYSSDVPFMTDGEYYYYTDGCKLFRTKEKLVDREPTISDKIKSFFDDMNDAIRFELPSYEEINSNIKALCGRKLKGVSVKFTKDTPMINARWLKDSMKAMNAKGMYYSPSKGKRSPVVLFEEDDLQSENILLILPINDRLNEPGYKDYDYL